MKSGFYISTIKHIRYFPKKYIFDYGFFWTRFDLDELDELHARTTVFSRNRFNLVSYYDNDHVNLGFNTTKENIQAFLIEQGVTEEIQKVELITNPRILGYTFNPVSFYFIETHKNPYVVIEIGNTFKEQKPYLVSPEMLNDGEWIFSTKKYFYISPFTSVENSMTFKIRRSENSLVINIDDFDKSEKLEVRASFSGKAEPWSNRRLLQLCLSYPFITLRIIGSIHYHAFRLFLLRVPFWKKSQNAEFQKDLFVWEKKSFRRRPKA